MHAQRDRAGHKEGKNQTDRGSNHSTDFDPEDDHEGIVVWKYPFKGKMFRIETPENISVELCEKLKKYIDVLKPNE
jgi:hypothetical protein